MKSKLKKYSLLLMAIVMVAVSALTVYAATPTTGSLTIITHEQKNGDTTTNPVMEGIEYTLYKVDETCEDYWDALYYVSDNNIAGTSETTNDEGKIVFDNLELGRYLVRVTYVPDGGFRYDNFLVDIPMTNAQGTGYDYDITVEPKIVTSFGNLELTKVDNDGNPISGVTFKVQVMTNYAGVSSLEDTTEDVWSDYIPEGSNQVLTVTTDSNGKITLNNLPLMYRSSYLSDDATFDRVTYRLVEISAPEGYIINNSILSNVTFSISNLYDSDYYLYADTSALSNRQKLMLDIEYDENLTKVTYVNEKPTVTKQVKNSEGTFVDVAGINATDTVTFKVTAEIPEQIADMATYKITDVLPSGLILDRSSIVVEGDYYSSQWELPTEYYTLSDTGLEITFNTAELAAEDYYGIIITYNATVDMDNITIGGDGNINTATLEYTNKIDIDGNEEDTTTVTDTANVHTGALKIEKVEKGNTATKLAGAKFKIATSEANAKAGTFVKDANGNDIEVETDANGLAEIKGLAYADDGSDTSYWLVETQAPTYTDTVDGQIVTKSYNLLKNPVEVQVGKTTYETAVQVQNSKGLDLPATGGIGIAIFAVVGITIMVISKKMSKEEVK